MKKIFTAVVLFAVIFMRAEEIKKLDTIEAWQNDPAVSCKDGIFTVKGKVQLAAAESFAVDPEKSYKFTVSCRAVNSPGTTIMPIVIQYDKNGRMITAAQVDTIGGTYTALLRDVKRGDNTVWVENASLWMRKRLLVIAFNAKEDYSDLPGSLINWNTITGIQEENGAYRVTLAGKIPFSVKKGGVRLHNNGPANMYPLGGKVLNDRYMTLSGKVSGQERKAFSHYKWAPGAVRAKFGLQVNFNKPDGVIEFKDVSIIVE